MALSLINKTSILLMSFLFIIASAATDYGYAPKPQEVEKSKPAQVPNKPFPTELDYQDNSKPQGKDKLIPSKPNHHIEQKPYPHVDQKKTIGVQGLVLCKSASNYFPLQGAVSKITCRVIDEKGYERAPCSVLSGESDAKGYFLATISPPELSNNKLKVKDCKATLHRSPIETCKVPTNVNSGINGALLSSYRILNHNKMKLYSVGPFFYTSQTPHSAPTGY